MERGVLVLKGIFSETTYLFVLTYRISSFQPNINKCQTGRKFTSPHPHNAKRNPEKPNLVRAQSLAVRGDKPLTQTSYIIYQITQFRRVKDPRVKEKQQVFDKQFYKRVFVSVTQLAYPASSQEHQPTHDSIVSSNVVWQIHRDKERLPEKETSQNESRLEFSWRQFQHWRQCKGPI